MNKIYAFLIIIPLIAILFVRTVAFYEFDTKQRYIKNLLDEAAHKVMITGVMTSDDKAKLLEELKKLGSFEDGDIQLSYCYLNSDGSLSQPVIYNSGNVLDRGAMFGIYVKSRDESTLSRVNGDSTDENKKLYYKAKALCRVEKKQPQN